MNSSPLANLSSYYKKKIKYKKRTVVIVFTLILVFLVMVFIKIFYSKIWFYKNDYLEGYNFVTRLPVKSVLWIEQQDKWTYKLYNSDPEDKNGKCHFDQLSWWDDGFLRYVKTFDSCPGSKQNEIVYDPPIVFLPKDFDKNRGNWSLSSTSKAKYYENGVLKCEGINNYSNKILEIEETKPGTKTVHWQTNQTTKWSFGNIAGKCFKGFVTRWQEDYWLDYSKLKEQQMIKAIKRSRGGNLDNPKDSWDIWFNF